MSKISLFKLSQQDSFSTLGYILDFSVNDSLGIHSFNFITNFDNLVNIRKIIIPNKFMRYVQKNNISIIPVDYSNDEDFYKIIYGVFSDGFVSKDIDNIPGISILNNNEIDNYKKTLKISLRVDNDKKKVFFNKKK